MDGLTEIVEETELFVFVDRDGRNSRFDLTRLESRGIHLLPTSASLRGARQQVEVRSRVQKIGAEAFHAPYFMTALRPGCPLIVSLYDAITTHFPKDIPANRRLAVRLVMRLALRSARAILTLSQFAKKDLVAVHGLPSERVFVTPAAVDASFRPSSPEEIAELRARLRLPERYVLHVGTDKQHKNLQCLVAAWAELYPSLETDCKLVLAGVHEKSEWSAADGVLQTGAVAEEDLPTLYSGAEVFVLPSLYEGFGLPVLEAMACGAPVACSKLASLPEVAGHAALYFDPEDPSSIATALTRLLKSSTYRQVLAERGRERARQLSWKQTARSTLEVYRRAASQP